MPEKQNVWSGVSFAADESAKTQLDAGQWAQAEAYVNELLGGVAYRGSDIRSDEYRLPDGSLMVVGGVNDPHAPQWILHLDPSGTVMREYRTGKPLHQPAFLGYAQGFAYIRDVFGDDGVALDAIYAIDVQQGTATLVRSSEQSLQAQVPIKPDLYPKSCDTLDNNDARVKLSQRMNSALSYLASDTGVPKTKLIAGQGCTMQRRTLTPYVDPVNRRYGVVLQKSDGTFVNAFHTQTGSTLYPPIYFSDAPTLVHSFERHENGAYIYEQHFFSIYNDSVDNSPYYVSMDRVGFCQEHACVAAVGK